jgi:hypothetical protein
MTTAAEEKQHILALLKDTDRTLPEREFASKYLPLLISTSDSSDPNANPGLFVSEWTQHVSGTVQASVNIVDDQGKYLFTIPPMVNSTVTDKGLIDVIDRVQELEGMHGAIAANFLEANLTAAIDIRQDQSEVYLDMWDEVLLRYNITTAHAVNKQKQIEQTLEIEDRW